MKVKVKAGACHLWGPYSCSSLPRLLLPATTGASCQLRGQCYPVCSEKGLFSCTFCGLVQRDSLQYHHKHWLTLLYHLPKRLAIVRTVLGRRLILLICVVTFSCSTCSWCWSLLRLCMAVALSGAGAHRLAFASEPLGSEALGVSKNSAHFFILLSVQQINT